MNVLIIEFWGSFNRFSLNLARALCKLNVEVTLVSTEDCIKEPSIPYKLITIFPNFSKKHSTFNKLYKYFRSYFFVLRFVRKSNVDLVNFQSFRIIALDWIFLLIMKIGGLQIVYTGHNILPRERKRYHKCLFKFIYDLCDLIIVTSESARSQIKTDLGVNARKLHVIPIANPGSLNFSVLPKKQARSLLGLPLSLNLVLFFGRIREYKGIDTLIKSIAIVRNKIKKIKLLIIGSCSDKKLLNYYYRLIQELGVQDIVDIRAEFVSDQDLPMYMASSDIVVLPYKTVPGHSGVLLLVYYFAKPVIASKLGGLSEVVEDGKSGFLVPPQ